MNNSIAHQSFNEVTEPNNDNVVKLTDWNGIQFLPSVSAYVDRVLSGYDEEDIRWNGLDVVKAGEQIGPYWKSHVRIQFPYGGAGEIKVTGADKEAAFPTVEEEAAILVELAAYRWPVFKTIPNIKAVSSPYKGKESDRFDFFNADGEPILVQFMRRVEGEKKFAPVTFWSDGFKEWVYPPGSNPIYNLHLVKERGVVSVFLHEGAKAARFAQEIADGKHPDHPWAAELKATVHLGWIGGAFAADETDFTALKSLGVKLVYIVPDADAPGENAVPQIAKQIDLLTYKIDLLGLGEFEGFDLADSFAKRHFKEGRYVGPTLLQRRGLATWATNVKVIPPVSAKANAKPTTETHLRDVFHRDWFYSTEDGIHVNRHFPTDIYDDAQLDREFGSFSDTAKLSAKLSFSKKTAQRVETIDIWPGEDRVFFDNGKRHFNAWSKPNIAQTQGDMKVWDEFLQYFIPDQVERNYFKKWLYTLIAKPEVRIGWGVLLQSEQTGTGKTTIGRIATSLVGRENVSFPTHTDVESQFTGWAAFKKLAIFNEFYTGGSNFKISNGMKSVMTDDFMTYNEKFKVARQIRCFLEVLACSNSERAIDLDPKDRRWFIPTVTEKTEGPAFWVRFNLWLQSGGLEAINFEAHTYGDYFATSERPMRTKKHAKIVANSKSEIRNRLEQFHADWEHIECWVSSRAVQDHVAKGKKVYGPDYEMTNGEWLVSQGWGFYGSTKAEDDKKDDRRPRLKNNGKEKRVTALASPALQEKLTASRADVDRQPAFDKARYLGLDDLEPY